MAIVKYMSEIYLTYALYNVIMIELVMKRGNLTMKKELK